MAETIHPTPLGHKILEHWRRHRPKMVENAEQAGISSSRRFSQHRS